MEMFQKHKAAPFQCHGCQKYLLILASFDYIIIIFGDYLQNWSKILSCRQFTESNECILSFPGLSFPVQTKIQEDTHFLSHVFFLLIG